VIDSPININKDAITLETFLLPHTTPCTNNTSGYHSVIPGNTANHSSSSSS